MHGNLQTNTKEKTSPPSPQNLTERIVDAALDVKGRDVTVLNVNGSFDLADYFVLVSGRSDRQVQGICNRVIEEMRELGIKPISVEGFDRGHWVLIDFGDVILHVFYEPLREHYDIEGLWARAKGYRVIPERSRAA